MSAAATSITRRRNRSANRCNPRFSFKQLLASKFPRDSRAAITSTGCRRGAQHAAPLQVLADMRIADEVAQALKWKYISHCDIVSWWQKKSPRRGTRRSRNSVTSFASSSGKGTPWRALRALLPRAERLLEQVARERIGELRWSGAALVDAISALLEIGLVSPGK